MAQVIKAKVASAHNLWADSKPLRVGAPHASTILQPPSMFCYRQLVLLACYGDHAHIPIHRPWDTAQNAIFLNGWHIHEKYQKLLGDHYARLVEAEEHHFDETRYVWYTPDVVTRETYGYMVWEIKGYHHEVVTGLNEYKDPPLPAWRQGNLYSHLAGYPYVCVFIEDKDTQSVKSWVRPVNHEMAHPYTDRMYKVKGQITLARNGHDIPARCCSSPSDRRAIKCPVSRICFAMRNTDTIISDPVKGERTQDNDES